ncbi:MAG: tetratricopeptide repeat protein [Chitinophagaceae bacterium]
MHTAQHYTEYIKQAKAAEEAGEAENAAVLYERAIKQEPFLEQPYNRLMIIYRKTKRFKDELRVLDKALDIFKTHYDDKKEIFKRQNTVGKLSKALLKSLGGDKESIEKSYPQPIPKWMIRRKTVEKKMKNS